jgi:hypothetical protein
MRALLVGFDGQGPLDLRVAGAAAKYFGTANVWIWMNLNAKERKCNSSLVQSPRSA